LFFVLYFSLSFFAWEALPSSVVGVALQNLAVIVIVTTCFGQHIAMITHNTNQFDVENGVS